MKIKLLSGLTATIITVSAVIYFLMPPKVISVNPSGLDQGIDPNSSLTIRFDRPLNRKELMHTISPEAYGEWFFEDPLMKNHFFQTLTFKPAIDFNSDTQYQVNLEKITSPLNIGSSGIFSFSFKTKADLIDLKVAKEGLAKEQSQAPVVNPGTSQAKPKMTMINIPLDWQDYSLSCEAACLKMALTSKGVNVSEDEIMEKIGYDLTPRKDGVWGDPDESYVGYIDGKMCYTGYGVYCQPVARVASGWCGAEAFTGWDLTTLTKELEQGNPVIIWGVLPVKSLHDCSWYTGEGKYVKAYQETHVRLAIGFIGEAENPSKIILNDPLSGRLYWSSDYFLTNWSNLGYSGVVLR